MNFYTCCVCEQQLQRRACVTAQTRQSLRCSHTKCGTQLEACGNIHVSSPSSVNSEIFAGGGVIFARLREMEKKTLSFTYEHVGESDPSRNFSVTWQICLLMLFAKIKFSRKFLNLQYNVYNCKCTDSKYLSM